MPNEMLELKTDEISEITGEPVIELLLEKAPTKVRSRIANAVNHYNKALKLIGVDEEMGAIRLIAAEEELVVAIFEWLKLNEPKFPEHCDFVRRFKNHQVKLAFYPVLSQLRFILADIAPTFAPDGLGAVITWSADLVCDGDRVDLEIRNEDGEALIRVNPFNISITKDGSTDKQVVEEMYADFLSEVSRQHGKTVREFVNIRSDFRNKLLYAEDGGSWVMAAPLEELLDNTFKGAIRDLMWTLGMLICNDPIRPEFGLVSQFISLYRKVLAEAVDARLAMAAEQASS